MDTAVPPPSRVPRGPMGALVVVIGVLTLAAVGVGTLDWPLPVRVTGTVPVAGVPGALTALVAVSCLICLGVAAALTLRVARLRWREPAGLAWLAIALAATAALAANALVSASYATVLVGAVIPVLHWLFTLVPALLAGAATARHGAATAGLAALGTGLVSVPLFGLGWALLVSREYGADALLSALWATAFLGAVPLAVAVALARWWGQTREWRAG